MGFHLIRADTPWKRFRGLMFRESIGPDDGLLLMPCNSIHTFFMRFDIDVIFLNKKMEVVELRERVKPRRIGPMCRRAHAVLECAAGFIAAHNVRPQQVLKSPDGAIPGDTHPGLTPTRFPANFV